MFKADIAKGAGELVRVSLVHFRQRDRIDIRQFYAPTETEPSPTRRGVNLLLTELPRLRAALEAAEQDAIANGLLTEQDYTEAGVAMPVLA